MGRVTIAARAALVDELVRGLWAREVATDRKLASGVAIAAIGGYGRGKLFPYSDVDLLVLLDGSLREGREGRDAAAVAGAVGLRVCRWR